MLIDDKKNLCYLSKWKRNVKRVLVVNQIKIQNKKKIVTMFLN